MLKFNFVKFGRSAALSLLMGVTAVAPLHSLTPVLAQPLPAPRNSVATPSQVVIPAGTQIPVSYDRAEKILVSDSETLPLTLTVAANIKDRNGNLLIPSGSQIVGQLQPTDGGSQFVAQELIVSQDKRYPLDATSIVVTQTETFKEGASTGDILAGTAAGAGAAAIIAGVTGDRRIDALEVLGGAAIGALAGWGLPEAGVLGGGSKEVISIDPNRDLTLTLQSQLVVALSPSGRSVPSGNLLGQRNQQLFYQQQSPNKTKKVLNIR